VGAASATKGTLAPRGHFQIDMWEAIHSLIGHVNDLQEAVEGMLMLRNGNELEFRRFLATLHEDDFRYLLRVDFDRMVLYLGRRFALYCNGLG
jgi:hypothetical protein